MRLAVAPASADRSATPLLVVLVDKGRHAKLPGGALGARAAGLTGPKKPFEGDLRQTLMLHAESRGGPRALLLLGMGKVSELEAEDFRRAGAIAARQAAELGANAVTITCGGKVKLDATTLGAMGEGAVLAEHRYPKPRAGAKPPASATIVTSLKGAAGVLKQARRLADGANLARELGDMPGNMATPRHLADTARKIGKRHGLRCKIHGKKDLERMKMGGILGVNQGSAQPPFLIELDYKPANYKRTICVVGKGLTFDAGGISIKPAAHMDEMKYDMCGGAATLGLMEAIGALKPKGVRVIGIVPTTENLLGANAYKPGDVLTTANGKTIEVMNTDAEGRVILSDALHHATKFKPDAIIDMATLTGAIVVALGHEAAGVFCADEKLQQRLVAAGARTGEKVWPMPTYDVYRDQIKGRFGDIKNAAGRDGGSCTAAQFLFHFTEGFPHAHIDIAGAAWGSRKRDYYVDGASGFGVRLLFDAITNWR